MKYILLITTVILLSGCQIEGDYWASDYPREQYGLEIDQAAAHDLSQSLEYYEDLSLLPGRIARSPYAFLDDSGSEAAIPPLLELVNLAGSAFFNWYDWEPVACTLVMSNHSGVIEEDYWQQRGEITGRWEAQECLDNHYDPIYFQANMKTHVDWVTEEYGSGLSQLYGTTTLDMLYESYHGSIRLMQSQIHTEQLFWGEIESHFDLLFNIENDDQHGLLSVITKEPLVFEPGDTLASSGWIQFKTDDHILNLYILNDVVRLVLDGYWLADYS